MDAINTTFASIGNANGMRMPKSDDNRESAAWDLFMAHHLVALAAKRKTVAEQAAVKAGVIIDKEKTPRPAGTREVCFSGNAVSVSLEVRNASPRVDTDKMADYLIAHKVSPALVHDAMVTATSLTKPAHVFTTMLVVSDATGK
jgi:hypothetical protein